MAATDFLTPRFPITGADIPVKNTTGSSMPSGSLVKLDTANPVSATQSQIGVVLTSAVTDFAFGFLVETIPAGGTGRCQVEGLAVGIALGAISVGAIVGPSATAGQVTTYTATDPAIGQAVTAAASAADPILIRIAPCRNA